MKYVVDTHVLIWYLENRSKLSTTAKAILSDPESVLVLSAIALAEAVWIVDQGKTLVPSGRSLWQTVQEDSRVEVYPLDSAVIEKTIELTIINEMHDRQIVATALVIQMQGEEVALLTCDGEASPTENRNITSSNLVPIIW